MAALDRPVTLHRLVLHRLLPPGLYPPPLQRKGGSKGPELRLFTDFYRSDIVVASPLGLVLTFNAGGGGGEGEGHGGDNGGDESESGGEGEGNDVRGGNGRKGTKPKRRKKELVVPAADFLSSIEAALVFDADVMGFQNWDHVLKVPTPSFFFSFLKLGDLV